MKKAKKANDQLLSEDIASVNGTTPDPDDIPGGGVMVHDQFTPRETEIGATIDAWERTDKDVPKQARKFKGANAKEKRRIVKGITKLENPGL